MIKVIIIAIFFVLGVLAIEMGNKDAVGTVISYSLPLLALVMYCLCNCSGYCRDLFTNCDIHILKRTTRERDLPVILYSVFIIF